jgi:dienelactone hydrolase
MKFAPLALLATAVAAQTLPPTKPLERQGDLAMDMVASIDKYLMARLAASPSSRTEPTEADRHTLRRLLGVVDRRVPFHSPIPDADMDHAALVGSSDSYEALAVRWPVLEGVDAEGLLLRPKSAARCGAVALPDADQLPEDIARTWAGRLAASRCMVLVPALIDRADTLSGHPSVRYTNQPHREFIHRMAYEMGRHIIGYEVQKVMAAVDWLAGLSTSAILVAGYGEGGLVAQFAAAVDTRIDAVLVSGYFGPREGVWREPIYRNVWSQLLRFGDAEVAGLIAPRRLVVEASAHPIVTGPPPEREGRRGAASGRIETPPYEQVEAEARRARSYAGVKLELVRGGPGSDAALRALLGRDPAVGAGAVIRSPHSTAARHERQFRQLVDHTQRLMRLSEFERKKFLAAVDTTDPAKFGATIEPYRDTFWREIQGKMPPASEPLSEVRARLLYDKPKFLGYEVVIPVWGEVYAYGILLLPKDLKPGEKRPVVVAQHGLEGRPQDVVEAKDARTEGVYANFAARMAEQGFIVFAPQNPYIGAETFRILMRKANPLKLSLYSFIIGQHDRILDWLETLPQVDKSRIGFYGLSYGGKTAMRVPSLLTRYALSICSGDFNEWVWKVVSADYPFSYMFTQEYDMLEFNLGHTFNYAEMALLIAPRPFMVERGHADGVGIDEWVSAEYAKVRRWYAYLGIPDRTTIEYFKGPHQIHGVGTYEFLHRHLNWPRR